MPVNSALSTRPQLPSLTGVRFIAAALVFFFHASLIFISMNPFADQGVADGFHWLFSKAGWMGVSFFFVLSGFVLTWSAKPHDTVTGFWRRRLLKIFPNHIATWAMAMVLFAGTAIPLKVWLPNLFLLHSWFPDPAVYLSLNAPAWSLCSELLFYLLFPFLIRPILRIKESALWVWAGAMVAGMLAVQLVTDFLAPSSPPAPGTDVTVWQFWFGYNFPPVRMFEFVLGMILARLVLAGRFPRVRILPAALLCVVGYAVAMVVPFLYGLNLATIVPIALLICAVARADVDGRPTVLRGRTMQWLGTVSFGFYLAQQIVLSFVRTTLTHHHLYATPIGIAMVAVEFFGALAVGWLLLVCVESPVMRRWARSRTSSKDTPAASPSDRQLTPAS
ncbi:peptidoglycan/LPS O-acetylase OafA/YrhL [Kitasatospora sp. GAS204A]|uniref:acyltransferase family protein n=1 Tax=unclassified Kitasatospora TaxID=2633591 RepID=UPI002472EDDC|nr:acyltransferase [Kitasatospora sp. GAS204B]MDH6120962.1 peptidoglycan/LPS O-acetylase OafA/YrhL [Kitasatospora sp. GAS204B]